MLFDEFSSTEGVRRTQPLECSSQSVSYTHLSSNPFRFLVFVVRLSGYKMQYSYVIRITITVATTITVIVIVMVTVMITVTITVIVMTVVTITITITVTYYDYSYVLRLHIVC